MNYGELIDDLKKGIANQAVIRRASKAIENLLQIHQLDQSEIVRLRRQIEVLQMEAGNG